MSADDSQGTPTAIQLKTAFKAFKRRLKLMQLDEESRIGGSPLSGGKRTQIMAIEPLPEFPQAVWDELVKQGKLRKAGRGLYELVTE
jgi:hypothetical protein